MAARAIASFPDIRMAFFGSNSFSIFLSAISSTHPVVCFIPTDVKRTFGRFVVSFISLCWPLILEKQDSFRIAPQNRGAKFLRRMGEFSHYSQLYLLFRDIIELRTLISRGICASLEVWKG